MGIQIAMMPLILFTCTMGILLGSSSRDIVQPNHQRHIAKQMPELRFGIQLI